MRFNKMYTRRRAANRLRLRLEALEQRTLLSGGLDGAFNLGGKQTVNFGDDDRATAVLVQPDGKIVLTGTYGNFGTPDFALTRLNPDGSLDTGFGAGGKTHFTFGGIDVANAAALQPDGKIVMAGYTDQGGGGGANNFAIARVNANGALDTGFANGGKLTYDFGFDDRATGVVVQPDGKIVVTGFVDGALQDFAAVRLNTNGTIDTGFGVGGQDIVGYAGVNKAYAAVLQPDGKIVLAGSTSLNGGDFAVVRLKTDGFPDFAFGQNGRVQVHFGFDAQANGVAVQLDGKIVLGGFQGADRFALARLNADGTLDTTFNSMAGGTTDNGNGKLSFGFGGSVEEASSVAIQPGGKIVIAGFTYKAGGNNNNTENFAAARINPNGTLDLSFNGTGKQTVDFGGDDEANGVALQPDGKIVLVGYTISGTQADFAVARLIGANVHFLAVGGAPDLVQVYSRSGTPLGSFSPFAGTGYADGVALALGDVNSDGVDDLVVSAVIGNPQVKVYSGDTLIAGNFFTNPEAHLLASGFPYAINFNVGANVAVGDVNGDGFADVITGAVPGNPHVKVFDGQKILATKLIPTGLPDPSVLAQGFVYGINFNVGANVAAGDVNGDGYADVITGASAGNPHTRVFDAKAILATGQLPTNLGPETLASIFPFALQFNVGAFVAAGDYNGDGYADVIAGSSVGNPQVRVYSGRDIAKGTFDPNASLLDNYFAFEQNQNIGVSVAAQDVTGDGRADVLVATRGGTPRHRVFQSNLPGPATVLGNFNVTDEAFTGGLYAGA
jgi:uncharacterized delta-60 repeat protein